MSKQKISVCLSPKLVSCYADENSVIIVIDVLRATSAICTALHHGAEKVIPVVDVRVARDYLNKGYIVGAERGGEIVAGFKYGNSPLTYAGEHVAGKTIVLTTSNGTFALEAAQMAHQVIIGSFLNLNAVSSWLKNQDRDIVLLCAGWKHKFNMEDTLFAGAVVSELLAGNMVLEVSDSAIAAEILYDKAKDNMFEFLGNTSHRNRLRSLDIEEDVRFCLTLNTTSVIPVLMHGSIVKMEDHYG